MLDDIVGVTHYFSNSFSILARKEYCSKLEKEFNFRSYVGVFFRLHQICRSQNHKNQFIDIMVIFFEYSTQILTKRAKASP